jgi:hypothetical protein
MKLRKTVSAAVVEKNQKNSQKSTGPKTAAGKQNSRRNALKHGLTAKRLMFTAEGKPFDNDVAEIVDALRERYGSDVVTELLIDNIAVDYWRQQRGLDAEIRYMARNGDTSFHPNGYIPNLQRYNTANRHAMLKSLEILEEMKASVGEGNFVSDAPSELDNAAATKDTPISSGRFPAEAVAAQPTEGEGHMPESETRD